MINSAEAVSLEVVTGAELLAIAPVLLSYASDSIVLRIQRVQETVLDIRLLRVILCIAILTVHIGALARVSRFATLANEVVIGESKRCSLEIALLTI